MKRYVADTAYRLDQFLAQEEDISRAQAVKVIKEGAVCVNDIKMMKPSKRLQEQDIVTIDIHDAPPAQMNSAPKKECDSISIDILYEDAQCMVIDKPSGIAVHPGSGTKDTLTVIECIQYKYGSGYQLAHRLDKDTTGCLLFAKTAKTLDAFQCQFKERSVQKQYLAIVSGVPENSQAIIEGDIGRSLVNRTKMSLFRTSTSRKAVTEYRLLGSDEEQSISLLECIIHTGRTHQIRVHLSSIHHPLLGDDNYGTRSSAELTLSLGIQRVQLHAWKLSFSSPESGVVQVTAPIPEDMKIILDKTNIPIPKP